ncbi:pyrroline-5-carboxylate reductase [Enterococcus dispar]|uniref:pyrroline-5-carboxylate reductase n=1 Tax=Enterococcus dispar TaxID=44009 RepID=UPI0018A11F70|nr:pyrroline-5-carboxylate reductase [Enterococcus dispar]MCU7357643.1 pyrroline-5-carboxylate reductase [Enterococcus dispar]MDT2706350.1 pyrroline-5-carboxylate reductase [Enterococcus dispar]WCG34236.1 pyrroline-5-carboxylate reductase [Enterococcus dispar]
MATIGFYGAGNMGQAMLAGLLQAEIYPPDAIFVYDAYKPSLEKISGNFGVKTLTDSDELIQKSDIIIFAVKPNILLEVLPQVAKVIKKEQLVVSIAAGITIDALVDCLGETQKILRVMPNTPALVGEAMSAVAANAVVTSEEIAQVLAIFRSFGKAEVVPEKMMDCVTGLSGSGPAFVYLFIEALADGAVFEGMSREMAYEFAAQTVLGAAKMVIETNEHPGVLKDRVTSPGGTTIAGVKVLETEGLRAAAMAAVSAATQKSRQLGN